MSEKPILSEYFEKYANILKVLHEASSLQEASDNLGANRECFHNNFLSKVLPKRLIVEKGEIWDAHGNKTGQLDTIIIRDDSPKLTFEGERDTFLAEGVFAVIEVKSNLAREKLREAGNTLKKVRDLQQEYPGMMSGGGAGAMIEEPFRIVFAYEGATEKTIMDEIKDNSWHTLFHLICILNRGVYEPNPQFVKLNEGEPYLFIPGQGICLGKIYHLLITYCQGYISKRIVLEPYLTPWNLWE